MVDTVVLLNSAQLAYEAEDQSWFNAQPIEALAFLWGIACSSDGASWDDEVHDALYAKGFFA